MTRDATRVHVTDVHVKQGVPGDENYCALGYALRDMVGNDPTAFAEVGTEYITLQQAHGSWWAQTPPEMADFISAFDELAGPDDDRTALQQAASAGLLQWSLTWHEGDPPQDGDVSG